MATCPLTRDEILDMILANLPEDKHIVSAVSGPTGTTLTRNDGQEFFVPVPNGNLTETDNNYIIEFNGERITIPKCFNRFLDCDGNVIDNCRDRMVTCENLDDRGYLNRVVTTDVISGTGTPADPVRFNCANAELIPDPEDHQVLLCGPQGVKKIDPNDLLSELCFNDVPDLGAQCGTVDQLVLITRDGCGTLAKTRAATQVQNQLYFQQVASPRLPQNTAGYTIPDNLPNPTNYYNYEDYVSDGGVSTTSGLTASARPAPGLNEARIANSRWGSVRWENACLNTYQLEVNIAHAKMDSADAAYDAWSGVGFRFRANGGAWNYPFSSGPGTLNIFAGDNAILGNRQVTTQLAIPEGTIDFEVFYIGSTTPERTAKWRANTYIPGFAVPGPRAFLRRVA